MESIIASDIKSFLFSNGLISDLQFGFRPGHSTLDLLLLLSQQWMEFLIARHEIRAIYPRHIPCLGNGLAPCPAHQTLFPWYPRTSPLMAQTSSAVAANVWPLMEFPHPRFLSRLEFLKAVFCAFLFLVFINDLSDSRKSSIALLMTPHSACPPICHRSQQQAAASSLSADLDKNHKLV